MSTTIKRKLISIRLTSTAIQLLDALAKGQGITRTATVELMIRKAAEEAEEKMIAVYDILHQEASD